MLEEKIRERMDNFTIFGLDPSRLFHFRIIKHMSWLSWMENFLGLLKIFFQY
jgi:hypothetical protein